MERWGNALRETMLAERKAGALGREELDLLRELSQLECRLRTPHKPLNRKILRWHGWRGTWYERFAKARAIARGILARGVVEEDEAHQLQVVLNLYPYFLDAQVAQASLFAKHGAWDPAAGIISWLLEMLPDYPLPMDLDTGDEMRQALEKLLPPTPPEGLASLKELRPPSAPPAPSPADGPLRPDEIHRLLRSRLGGDEWLRAQGQLLIHLLAEGLSAEELLGAWIQADPFLILMLPDGRYLKTSSSLFSLVEHCWLLGSCAPAFAHEDASRPLLVAWDGTRFDPDGLDALLTHWGDSCGVDALSPRRMQASLAFEADRRNLED